MVSRQKAKSQWLLAVFVYIIWITAVIMLRELTTLPPYVAYFFLPLAVIPLLIADYRLARAKHLGLAKTVRKKTKELSIALLHAEEARKAQSEFLAHMSHELRTPLNAIMGFSAATAREAFGPIGNPIYKEYADCIYQSGSHLLGIINNILDLSKMNANQMKLHCQWIYLIELINDSLQMTIAYPGRQERKIDIVGKMDAVQLFVDRQLFRQVLLNILSNAIKFTSEGGRISIRADMLANGNLDIQIKDNGIGIPSEKIQEVVKPFTQIENMMTRVHNGTGLGLALSDKIMQLHNGELTIDSIENKGTCVHLIVPAGSLKQTDDNTAII